MTETSDEEDLMAQSVQTPPLLQGAGNSHETCIHAVNGEEIVAHPSGAAYWPARDTLLVADLHLEKGSSFARKGQLLPPYDTGTTLKRLAVMVAQWQPRRVIALGDSFHDDDASNRLLRKHSDALAAMMKGRDWVWISGNHDPSPPQGLGGDVAELLEDGALHFRHEPTISAQAGEVAGHLHPKACLVRRGRYVRRSCFAASRTRLIMPSFGAYTGGLSVFDAAFHGLFEGRDFHVLMRGEGKVYRIKADTLKR